MDEADLYLSTINVDQYFSEKECVKCGVDSCKNLVNKLQRSEITTEISNNISANKLKAIETALNPKQVLPVVPKITFPRPIDAEMIEINQPKDGDPIIVTGNNQYTQEVLLTIFANTVSSFFLLFTDTRGDTLDMAVVFKSFTVEAIQDQLKQSNLDQKATNSPIVIPGKAADLKASLQKQTKLTVEVGPVCAAEIPLFFGDRWVSR